MTYSGCDYYLVVPQLC